MNMQKYEENKRKTEGLFRFIERAVSPYDCVAQVASALEQSGFQELDFSKKWELQEHGKYYFRHYGSTLIAFCTGAEDTNGSAPQLKLAAAHTDFPCLRIKSHPDRPDQGYHRLNAEVYGGAVLSSWLDRPLGIAGKVAVADGTSLKPQIRYVHPNKLRLTVPGYAIHLNREMNNGVAYDKQKDMQPLYATVAAGSEALRFEEELAQELDVAAKDILEYELFTYNADEPCLVGADGMLISSPRLDNMSSVYSVIEGICQAQPDNDLKVAAIFHHEEIGSRTKEGAASAFFQMALEKIYLSCGYDRESFLRAVYGGMMISADVSQGRHPAQPEKYDPTNSAILNDGFAVKKAGGQSYATDCEAIAIVKMLCRQNGIFCQDYYNRSNLAGGSTIGAIASTFLPMRIADVGIPLLSMHSARECAGVEDFCGFSAFMKAFYA